MTDLKKDYKKLNETVIRNISELSKDTYTKTDELNKINTACRIYNGNKNDTTQVENKNLLFIKSLTDHYINQDRIKIQKEYDNKFNILSDNSDTN